MSYVGSRSDRARPLAGENLIKGLAAEGKTKAQVVGDHRNRLAAQGPERMAGFKEALAKDPGIKLVADGGRKVEHRDEREDRRRSARALPGQAGSTASTAWRTTGDGHDPGDPIGRPEARRGQQGHRRRRRAIA